MLRRFRFVVALLVFFASTPVAFAQTFCVSGWDGASGLTAAFDAMAGGNSVSIKLVRGTYTFDNAAGRKLAPAPFPGGVPSISIKGGYAAGCAEAQRVIDADNTVIDGALQPLSQVNLIVNGDLVIEGITFMRLIGPSNGDAPVNISHVYTASASGESMTVNRCRFIGLKQRYGRSLRIDGSGSDGGSGAVVRFSDNLVADNAGDSELLYGDDGFLKAYNNTFAHNAAGAIIARTPISDGNDAIISVSNNIFWNTGSGIDLDLTGTPDTAAIIDVTYNVIGTVSPSPSGTYAHNLANDPLFVDSANADFTLRDYHLAHSSTVPAAGDSPAINAGTYSLLDPPLPTDVAGATRIVGNKLDIGAFESPVDDRHNYVVSNTLDNGNNSDLSANPHSLRWAILNAKNNASIGGSFTISFDVPCGSIFTVNAAAPLPDVDIDLTVDGQTNPGWLPNNSIAGFQATLCVALYGGNTLVNALRTVGNGRLTVRGLTLFSFTGAALSFGGGAGSVVEGNFITLNGDGIAISAASGSVSIGAAAPAARNVITGNTNIGISLANTGGFNHVVYNLIGLGADGATGVGNGRGIVVTGSPYNIITGNSIDANTGPGLTLTSAASNANVVQGNRFGLAEIGQNDVSNGSPAIWVTSGATNNAIGAVLTATAGGNYVWSDQLGIWVDASAGVSNRVLGNSVVTQSLLPLDLDVLGPTANGPGTISTANHRQHFPVIINAYRSGLYEWMQMDLDAAASESFRIDVYASATDGDQGRGLMETYLGKDASATTDASGHARFWVRTYAPPGGATADANYMSVTATATKNIVGSSAGDTSEVSAATLEIVNDMIFRDDLEVHQ